MTEVVTSIGQDSAGQPATESRTRFVAHTLVRVTLGLLLIAAALLKGFSLATDPFAKTGLPGPRWLAILVIEGELFLGAWLLSGWFARAAWGAATICFGAFAVLAFHKGVSGAVSCGCFGKLAVDPWVSFVLDLAAVAALLIVPAPRIPERHRDSGKHAPWLFLLLLAVVVTGAPAMYARALPGSSIGLVCKQRTHDFGTLTVPQAKNLAHTFELKNVSSDIIRIVRTKSTCGCTAGEPPREPILPGATATVRVSADWGERPGRRMEEVLLLTEGAGGGQLALTITGNVRTIATLSPGSISFGNVYAGETNVREFRLQGPAEGDSTFQITSVEAPGRGISVIRVRGDGAADPSAPLTGDGGRFRVMWVSEGLEAGMFATSVLFHTNLNGQSTLTLPIRAHVRSSIAASPPSLLFRPDAGGQAYSAQMVTLLTKPGLRASFAVTSGDFSAECAKRVFDEPVTRLTIRYHGKGTEGVTRGNLRISSTGATVDVPLMAVSF